MLLIRDEHFEMSEIKFSYQSLHFSVCIQNSIPLVYSYVLNLDSNSTAVSTKELGLAQFVIIKICQNKLTTNCYWMLVGQALTYLSTI